MLAVRSATMIVLFLFLIAPAIGTAAARETRSEHEYHNDPMTYLLFSFVMSFATVSFLMGVFGFKYGKKRTRVFSVPMIAIGLLIWGIWLYFNVLTGNEYPDDTFFDIIHWVAAPLMKPIMALLGAAIGFGSALIIFLNTIVRP